MMSFLSVARTACMMWLFLEPGESSYWGSRNHKDFRKTRETRRASIDTQVSRKVQKCAKMEFIMTCQQYFFAIWDGDGKYVYDSYLFGTEYSECYDPSQCYLFEIVSESDDCTYKITMDGKVAKQGKVLYDPSGSSLVARAGVCTETCPGMRELLILSYIEYGDIDYILHISGQGDVEGVIAEGDYRSFCIIESACNVIVRTTLGWSFYFVLDGEDVMDMGGFEKTKTFGNCQSTCTDVTLLMSTNPRDGDLQVSLAVDDVLAYNNSLTAGEEAIICIDTLKCNVLDGQGMAYYYFFRDGQVIDRGLTPEYRLFGPCETICMKRPVLASTQRGQDIVIRVSTMSGMADLANFNSARYKAACWLVYDDLKALEANDPKIIQRYILAVLYLTTDGPNWEGQLGFMGGKDECSWEATGCNDQGFVNYIYLGFNNLVGPLAPEVFSLTHLDFFDITRNYFTGTIPDGLSRLPIKYLDIFENTFTGTLPQDIFLIDGNEYLSIGRNLLSGTIPNARKGISKITELWFQNNFLSGTIPEWINEITALTNLFLHFNHFTGQLPDYDLPNLRKFWLWDNDVTGTVPTSIFTNPSLRELILTENHLSGPLIIPDNYEKSLTKLWMNHNKLTGTVPSLISKMNKLQDLYLSDNTFSGTFPQELKELKKLFNLRIENNNITGTIPFEDCKKFVTMSSDCSAPINMDCKCCTRCAGMFTTYKDVLDCPSSILNVSYYSLPGTKMTFNVENDIPQAVVDVWEYSTKIGDSFINCISPTDCLTLTSSSDVNFELAVDGNLLFEGEKGSGNRIKFGYAADGTMKPNTCDDYIICNRSIRAKTKQRRLINLITRISGLDIFGGQASNQYDSLCWWINDLDRLTEDELESTVLVQRYFLALLYNSNGGPQWINNQNWMSGIPECEWYGISCDTYDRVISKIDLSNNNMIGTMPSEIGEIRGLEHLILSGNTLDGSIPLEIVKLLNLKSLDLSRNRIDGSIPPEVQFLTSLQDLDINTNKMTSTIPSEIRLVKGLRSINLGDNAFSGEIPNEIRELEKLTYIAVGSNLMRGELAMLGDLYDLEYFDFSNNYFSGTLPLFGSRQKNLRTAILNNNQFEGAIPSGIEELTGLDTLMAFGNSLTGSLPSQLGRLHNISSLSFAYNLLKGTISSELSNMKKLSILHLHSNSLEGYSDFFNYTIDSYITDCGKTETSDGLTECSKCSECCNTDGACITTALTWPRNSVKELKMSPSALVVSFSIGVSIFVLGLCALLQVFSKKLPRLPYFVRQEFQQDSVYRWFLSTSKIAWAWALFSLAFQFWIIVMFLQAGDFSFDGNLWLYSIDCPDSKTTCSQKKVTNIYGWITFTAILAVFLLQDFIPGVQILYESSVEFDSQGIIAGLVLLNITILSTVASGVFIYATSLSNIAIIKDAVIVLFLNSIDEQIFMIVQRAAPDWTDDVEANIMNKCLDKITQEISEVIDDDDTSDYAPEVDVGYIYQDDKYDHGATPSFDKSNAKIDVDYADYDNGYADYAEDDIKSQNSPLSDLNIDAVKEELISEIMGIYDADKAKFRAAHEVETAHILDELKGVKEELKGVKEENSKLMALINVGNRASTEHDRNMD